MILTQIKDDGIGVRHEIHRRDYGRRAELRWRKRIEFNVADVVIEDFKL